MKATPSRVLNEKSNVMGFTIVDLVVLGYALIFIHKILEPFNLAPLSFIIILILALVLMNIRSKSRAKTIRDFIGFKLKKSLHLKRQVL